MTNHTAQIAKWNALDKESNDARDAYSKANEEAKFSDMSRVFRLLSAWEEAEEYLKEEAPSMLVALNEMAAEVERLKLLIAEVGGICNGIHARDGAPFDYEHKYFDTLVKRMNAECDGDCLVYGWKHAPTQEPKP